MLGALACWIPTSRAQVISVGTFTKSWQDVAVIGAFVLHLPGPLQPSAGLSVIQVEYELDETSDLKEHSRGCSALCLGAAEGGGTSVSHTECSVILLADCAGARCATSSGHSAETQGAQMDHRDEKTHIPATDLKYKSERSS